MARNGSGTYVVYTPGNPVVTGTTISSTAFNNTINDIATALTGSISADGQTPITANIPMNSHKLTGLAAPTVAGDALSYGGVVAGSTGAFTSSALGTQVIATNGGTTTLTSTSPYYTVFTGTFVQTLVLPDATTLTVGQQYGIDNDGSLAITVKTNGGATLWTIASGCDLYLTLTAQATAVGTWETDYQGAQLATGKTLVVNNSVTVNGTDGTTMTLPAVSGTLATLAGSETLTNKALNGSLGATTPSTVVATTIGASGLVTGASFQATGNAISATGDSLEGFVAASQAFVGAINRTSGNYLPLINTGSTHTWRVGVTTTGGITYTAQMNANGGLQVPNTVGVGGATPSTSGAGITFPATQSASTDANTLDDYEEGGWTPNQGAGLTVVGAFSSSGTYTKIGRVVTVTAYYRPGTSVAVAGNGLAMSTNLPFSAASVYSTGTVTNDAQSVTSGCLIANVTVLSTGVIAATPNVYWSATYTV